MIGQHIYSRCLEGYFSKSRLNADSTTVTISIDMFAREEQAKRIARECEKVSTLEDVRPVPAEVQGAYRGVLKIRRLNRQLTVVCRSYRLHSAQAGAFSGGGETRDFTYGSSYILSGEEKELFLEHPEYCLNIQDFESYPSMMKRIEESRARGYNGRIEANENYSLFRSQCRDASPNVFQQAGFTKKVFIDYISSIIQRVSYSHYSGHEKDKVLVVLPQRFNMPWEKCGGNRYAEEVLTATLKILPKCVRGQLNATTGGMHDPGAFVLDGYQLVFMEPGSAKDWRKSEYSLIDLDRQESFVTEGLDTEYGEFLWNYLFEEETRKQFENQYLAVFGEERTAEDDNSPEKFSLILHLLQEEAQNFADSTKRSRLLTELVEDCGDAWTERGEKLALQALTREAKEPGYDKGLEEVLLELVQKESCPEKFRAPIITCILQDILHGDASDQAVLWICEGIRQQDSVVVSRVMDANRVVSTRTETPWYRRRSLLDFYYNICKNPEIYADTKVKREILSILSNWYIDFLEKNDWENCVRITQILSEQLEDPRLETEGRRDIYQDLIYLLFYGEGDGRKQISDILKKEERKFTSNPQNAALFWECFKKQMREKDIAVNEDVIWQMTYLAVSQDDTFLQNDWEPLYKYLVQEHGGRYGKEIFETTREYFLNWMKNIQDEQKLQLVYRAIAICELDNLEFGQPYYLPDMDELRKTLGFLEENGMNRFAAKLLYRRYQAVSGQEQRKLFFVKEFNRTEQWQTLLFWMLSSDEDSFLNGILPKFSSERKEFLHVIAGFEWEDKKEVMKTAKVYFYLLQYYVKETYSEEDPLCVWCWMYRSEIGDIRQASGNTEFAHYMGRYFKQKLAKFDQLSMQNLAMEDVVFLKESGMLPLGEGWECLDVLSEIYMAEPQCVSEEFLAIREKVIGERSSSFKQIYLEALEAKRELLLEAHAEGELVCNLALLEEQMCQELERNDEFSLQKVTLRIFEKAGSGENLITALHLLYVIRCYGFRIDKGVYDCTYVQKLLYREIVLTAKMNADLFANKKVLRAYKQLDRDDKAVLLGNGLRENLQGLSGEWKDGYGIREEKNKMEAVIPGIFAGVFLLLGIGLELLLFFFYGSIGAQAAIITGIVLVAVGVIGDAAVLIWMLISKEQQNASPKMRRKSDELSQM